MATLSEDSPLSMFRQRCEHLKRYQDEHQLLINEMKKYSESLWRELTDCRLDLDDAKNSRRYLQQQIQAMEAKLQNLTKENDEHKNRHPYVAVLIDGDGLLFHEDFINDGMEGGKRAAVALRDAVDNKCSNLPSKMEIVVKVCANLSGLATALCKAGSISSESLFKQFTLGFTQAKASFDFIDVGHGKERADSKIREDARWHLNNVNCHRVILGISHDSGYAPFLDELCSDRETRQRICILEGSPTVPALVTSGLDIVNFSDTVFRSNKLQVDRVTSATAAAAAAAASRTNGITNGSSRPGRPSSGSSQSDEVNEKTGLPTTPTSRTPPPPTGTTMTSYASATNANMPAAAASPPAMKFPTATTKTLQAKAAAAAVAALAEKIKSDWSPGPRGLDPPAIYNAAAVESVKKRRGPDKFCNVYAITGACQKDSCEYNHKLKITPDEKKALIYLMRQSPCTYGQDCTMDGCIYGHNCPSVRDGQCMQPYCKFASSLHPPKTKLK